LYPNREVLEPRDEREDQEGVAQRIDGVVFLRLPEVKAITGLSKTSLYELVRAKDFPAPIRLAPRAVAWIKSEVNHWAEERILASRSHSEKHTGKRATQRVQPETGIWPRKSA